MRQETIICVCDVLETSTDNLLRGIITPLDYKMIAQKYSYLTSIQYQHPEDIIINYVSAVKESEA